MRSESQKDETGPHSPPSQGHNIPGSGEFQSQHTDSPLSTSTAAAPRVVPPKKKRTRTLTTPHQSAVLHALLAQSRFPTTATREEVGRSIGLSARKVQIWFQNQRQKARRPKSQQSSITPKPTDSPRYATFHTMSVPRNDLRSPYPSPPSTAPTISRHFSNPSTQCTYGGDSGTTRLLGPGMPGWDTESPRLHSLPLSLGRLCVDRPIWSSSSYTAPRPVTAQPRSTRDDRSCSLTLPPLKFDSPHHRTSFSAPGPSRAGTSPPLVNFGRSYSSASTPSAFDGAARSPVFAHQPPEQHQLCSLAGRTPVYPPRTTRQLQPRWERPTLRPSVLWSRKRSPSLTSRSSSPTNRSSSEVHGRNGRLEEPCNSQSLSPPSVSSGETLLPPLPSLRRLSTLPSPQCSPPLEPQKPQPQPLQQPRPTPPGLSPPATRSPIPPEPKPCIRVGRYDPVRSAFV